MTVGYDADLLKTGGVYDLQIDSDGDIKTTDFFDTALLMSLMCERRANSSEVYLSQHRRGWIGNESYDDFENGSKVWLYEQARITRTTLNNIETSIFNGLKWLLDDKLVLNVEVSATLEDSKITAEITIERSQSNVEKRYFDLWDNTGS